MSENKPTTLREKLTQGALLAYDDIMILKHALDTQDALASLVDHGGRLNAGGSDIVVTVIGERSRGGTETYSGRGASLPDAMTSMFGSAWVKP